MKKSYATNYSWFRFTKLVLYKNFMRLYLQVVYLENAHHQHVYEDSHDDSWGSSGSSGSYWKRSLPIENNSAENVPVTSSSDRINQVSYNPVRPVNIKQTATYSSSASSYRQPTTYEEYNASPQLAQYTDPHSLVYSQQMPQQTYSLN